MEFSTDFSKILFLTAKSCGIPAIDDPVFVDVEEENNWLKPVEQVILVEVGKEACAYPFQILI